MNERNSGTISKLGKFTLAFAAAAFISAVNWGTPASAASLSVQVENLRNQDGNIIVALYDSASSFLDAERHVIIVEPQAARGDTMEVVFDGLPPGDYAAAAYHDENLSGEFDTNFLGIPLEGYGFTNGARAGLGPPDFEEAAVAVGTGSARTELALTY
jgi:uncharacterized protein (DUF2141 family)